MVSRVVARMTFDSCVSGIDLFSEIRVDTVQHFCVLRY
jgi:hypothetical protein